MDVAMLREENKRLQWELKAAKERIEKLEMRLRRIIHGATNDLR